MFDHDEKLGLLSVPRSYSLNCSSGPGHLCLLTPLPVCLPHSHSSCLSVSTSVIKFIHSFVERRRVSFAGYITVTEAGVVMLMVGSSQTRIFEKVDGNGAAYMQSSDCDFQYHLVPVVFASSPSLQGFSFPPALNAYSGHQLARTNLTL